LWLILDIDDTLADPAHRRGVVQRPDGSYDWDRFIGPAAILRDPLVSEWVWPWEYNKTVLRQFCLTSKVLYLTGRQAKHAVVTERWLWRQGFPTGTLLCRDTDEPDDVFKERILAPLAREIRLAVDDCGVAYRDPWPLVRVYERLKIPLCSPYEAFGLGKLAQRLGLEEAAP